MAKKILVVDDVEDSRSILVIILQRFYGYETIEGQQAGRRSQRRLLKSLTLS
jgi:hypoxanthine phosphoribosyltransferase